MTDGAPDMSSLDGAWSEQLGVRRVGESSTTLEMGLTDDHLNFLDGAHGGALFTLAETAAVTAARADGPEPTLIDAHLTLTSGGTHGDVFTARVDPVSVGRTLGVYRVEVTRGDGRLVGEMTTTFRFG